MAVYNNGFPATYQPVYYPQYPQQFQQPQPVQQPQPQPVQQGQASMIWVQGEGAARSYLMAPNTTLPLWDSEANVIYLKTTDAAGMPSMKVLDYSIRDNASHSTSGAAASPSQAPAQEYAGKAETAALRAEIEAYKADIESLRSELEAFRGDLYGIAGKKTVVRKKEVADND